MKLKSSLLALFLLLGALSLRASLASCLQGCDLDYSRKISILEPQYNQANLKLSLYALCATNEFYEMKKYNDKAARTQPTNEEILEYNEHSQNFVSCTEQAVAESNKIKTIKAQIQQAKKGKEECQIDCKEKEIE